MAKQVIQDMYQRTNRYNHKMDQLIEKSKLFKYKILLVVNRTISSVNITVTVVVSGDAKKY